MAMWFNNYSPGRSRVRHPDVCQLLWADAQDRFPDDPLCDPNVVAEQPLLAKDPLRLPQAKARGVPAPRLIVATSGETPTLGAGSNVCDMSSLLDDPAISLARLSVAQYHRMIETGVLVDGEPLELEIAAVIEVAGSSLARDRSTKQRIYARAGIQRYIIINLTDETVEVYSAPTAENDAHYGQHETIAAGTIDLGPVAVDAAALLG